MAPGGTMFTRHEKFNISTTASVYSYPISNSRQCSKVSSLSLQPGVYDSLRTRSNRMLTNILFEFLVLLLLSECSFRNSSNN